MPRTRPAYLPDFAEQIVALACSGRRVEDLAREFKPCLRTMRSWIAAGDLAEGRPGGPPPDRPPSARAEANAALTDRIAALAKDRAEPIARRASMLSSPSTAFMSAESASSG